MRLLSFADVHAPVVIHLADARPILLDELIQFRTYAGLLVGLPEERHVGSVVDQALNRAQEHFGDKPVPHMLEFELVDYEQEVASSRLDKAGRLAHADQRPQRKVGRRLPLVTCMASFECPVTVSPPVGVGVFAKSIATLVWFQETFGPPLAGQVIECIRILDWAAIAVDISD